jgi:NAD(P)H-quinone oxidoreductase subunit 5
VLIEQQFRAHFAAATSALTGMLALTRPADLAAQPVALAFAALALAALATIAAIRRWAPTSPLALVLLALGHRLGASPVRVDRQRETSPLPTRTASTRIGALA